MSNIRNIDQSETFFVIILHLDQWIRCCVKSSIFSSGDYNVQKSRLNWLGNFSRRPYKECQYKLYEMISNLDQYNVVHLLFKIYFLSKALAAILAGRAESFGQFLEV